MPAQPVLPVVDDQNLRFTPAWIATAAQADIATAETTTSPTYVDLATPGPSVTVSIGPSGKAMVLTSALASITGSGTCFASFNIDGGSSTDADALASMVAAASGVVTTRSTLVTGLTPGLHLFKMRYRRTAGTATFSGRRLIVTPI